MADNIEEGTRPKALRSSHPGGGKKKETQVQQHVVEDSRTTMKIRSNKTNN